MKLPKFHGIFQGESDCEWMGNNSLSTICLSSGFLIIAYLFSIFLLSTLSLLLHHSLTGLIAYAAAIVVIPPFIYWNIRRFGKRGILNILISLLIVGSISILCFITTREFYDTSFDGQGYQTSAVILLKEGYNPYYDTLEDDHKTSISFDRLWITHYPKALWYIQAVLSNLTGIFERIKIVDTILIIGCFLFTLGTFLQIKSTNKILLLIITIILFCNPVIVGQILSFMNDGVSTALLNTLIASIFLLVNRKSYLYILPTILIVSLLVNIKFTNILYIGGVIAIMILILWLKGSYSQMKRLLVISFFSGIIALPILGFQPYITNLLGNGNPFYPLIGKNSLDITRDNVPENLLDKSSIERFVVGIISKPLQKTSDNYMLYKAEIKIPFSVTSAEIYAFGNFPLIAGGFGPWFSGLIVATISILAIYPYLAKRRGIKDRNYSILLAVIIALTLLNIVNPLNTLARYIPLVWDIPIVVIVFLALKRERFTHVLMWILLLITFVNIAMISIGFADNEYSNSKIISNQFSELKYSTTSAGYSIMTTRFRSAKYRLEEYGIPAELDPLATCNKPIELALSYKNTYLCRRD